MACMIGDPGNKRDRLSMAPYARENSPRSCSSPQVANTGGSWPCALLCWVFPCFSSASAGVLRLCFPAPLLRACASVSVQERDPRVPTAEANETTEVHMANTARLTSSSTMSSSSLRGSWTRHFGCLSRQRRITDIRRSKTPETVAQEISHSR